MVRLSAFVTFRDTGLSALMDVNFINYISAIHQKCLGLTGNTRFMFWFY